VDSIATDGKAIEEKITNLQNAIRHLNSNGDISKIDSQIIAEAVRRSRIYKKRVLKNGIAAYDKADGQTLLDIPASSNYEHIGAAVANDVQKYLGLLAPKVFVSGSGVRRPYLLQESIDVAKRAKINRESSSDLNNYEDMLRIAVSDFITDTRDRDLSTIVSINASGGNRTIASINRNAALAGIGLSAEERRRMLKAQDFYSEEYLASMRANFAKRSEAQRRIALKLFDAMLTRLRQYDVSEMASRLALDGSYSQAEKTHIDLVKKLIETRINILSNSKKSFLNIIGLEI
jgi:phage baseplate assembly protein W